MTQDQRFVGIDVSGARLDVHCHPDGESFAVANSPTGIARLTARLGPAGWIAACEATGGLESELLIALNEAGHHIWCLHPADVRAFTRLTGRRAKTDRLDARAIARALEAAHTTRKPLRCTRAQSELKQLMAFRQHLLTTLTQLKSLKAATTCNQARCLIETRISATRDDLAGLSRTLARRIADDPHMAATARRIISVPGAGKVLATQIIASMPELGSLSAKQAASLAGVAPHPRLSGSTTRPGRCQAGRAKIRRCLYMAALSAIKARLAPLYPTYEQLRQNGKPAKVAIVACMRKLITILNAILKQQTSYQQPWQLP